MLHKELWVRVARKACWPAYYKIRLDAIGHPGIFGILHLTHYVLGHTKAAFHSTEYLNSPPYKIPPFGTACNVTNIAVVANLDMCCICVLFVAYSVCVCVCVCVCGRFV